MKTLEEWEKHFDIIVLDEDRFRCDGNDENTKFTREGFLLGCHSSTLMIDGDHNYEFLDEIHAAIKRKAAEDKI